MSGNLDMGTNTINNLASPSSSSDAATKSYVDNNAGVSLGSGTWDTAYDDTFREVSCPSGEVMTGIKFANCDGSGGSNACYIAKPKNGVEFELGIECKPLQ